MEQGLSRVLSREPTDSYQALLDYSKLLGYIEGYASKVGQMSANERKHSSEAIKNAFRVARDRENIAYENQININRQRLAELEREYKSQGLSDDDIQQKLRGHQDGMDEFLLDIVEKINENKQQISEVINSLSGSGLMRKLKKPLKSILKKTKSIKRKSGRKIKFF